MKGHSRHNSSLIGRKNQAKFENDSVSRNGHRIEIIQPNSIILVPFSSAEDALFNYVKKKMTLLNRRVLEIRRSYNSLFNNMCLKRELKGECKIGVPILRHVRGTCSMAHSYAFSADLRHETMKFKNSTPSS